MALKTYVAYETRAYSGTTVAAARQRAKEVKADILARGIWRGRRVEKVTIRRSGKVHQTFEVLVYSRT